MALKTYAVQLQVTVNTDRCDLQIELDDQFGQVLFGVTKMLNRTFPSGEFGPDRSLADIDYDSLKIS